MNAVAMRASGPAETLPASHPVQTISESGAVLQMIERAARDPSVDLDKLERLMALRREAEERQAKVAFISAMRDAQADMRPVSADATNPQTRSKYATYAKLDAALRPIYTKHGFCLTFDEADSPKAEHVRVVCYVAHEGGFERLYHRDMPADGKGAKGNDVMTKTHAAGAAGSYGMRYLLKGIFNVAVGEDDRDGNVPKDRTVITEEQVMQIRDLIEASGADLNRFLKVGKIERLEDMHPADFASSVQWLKQKGGAR